MHAGRHLGLSQVAPSSQVAAIAIAGGGLVACPVVSPAAFGFAPTNFLAIYRMAYERAMASLAAEPTLYERLMSTSWN